MDGNTALHVAVTSHRNESVAILLEAGADPTLYNHTCFSPLLKASMNGFYGYVSLFSYVSIVSSCTVLCSYSGIAWTVIA